MNPLRSIFARIRGAPHLRDLLALWGAGLAIVVVLLSIVFLFAPGESSEAPTFKNVRWAEWAFGLAIPAIVVIWHSARVLKRRRRADERRAAPARSRRRSARRSLPRWWVARLLGLLAPAVAVMVAIATGWWDSLFDVDEWILPAMILIIVLILFVNGFLPRRPR